jgi:hypothetical protein
MDPIDPPDDPVDPPTEGPASITFNDGGEPFAGLAVIFHNPDGTVIKAGETDADGKINATVPFNAMMSIVMGGPVAAFGDYPTYNLYTIMGVQPNDEYTFDLNEDSDESPPYQQLEVVLPGPVEGATNYYVRNGCDGNSTGDPAQHVFLPVYEDCVADGKGVVLAMAYNGETPIAYSFVENITPTPILVFGGGPSGQIVNMGAWQTTFTEIENDLIGYPPGYQYSGSELMLAANGVALDWYWLEMGYLQPNGVYDQANYQAYIQYENDITTFTKAGSPPTGAAEINLAANLPGRIIGQSVIPADDNRPTFSFYSTADPAKMDGGVFCVEYDNHALPGVGLPTTAHVVWNFLVPPGVSSFKMPVLPEDYSGAAPDSYTFYENSTATMIGTSHIDGYDAFRLAGMFEAASSDIWPDDLAVGDSFYLMQHWNYMGVELRHQPKPTKKKGKPSAFGGGLQYYCQGIPL